MKPSAPEVTYMSMTHAMSEAFLKFVANADISCEMVSLCLLYERGLRGGERKTLVPVFGDTHPK